MQLLAITYRIIYLTVLLIGSNILVEASLKVEGIVGGDYAKEGQFKYHAAVYKLGYLACGAGIIHDRFVLTAAHCILNSNGQFQDELFWVIAGISSLTSTEATAVHVEVEKSYAPKAYKVMKYNTADNFRIIADIAVLRLKRSLELNTNKLLGKLELPKPTSGGYLLYSKSKAVITGFGFEDIEVRNHPKTKKIIEIKRESSFKLKYAETRVLVNDECIKNAMITPFHICAKVCQRIFKKSGGVCGGDSGGPLVFEKNIIIGVLSQSPVGCREDLSPGIYTRVTHFVSLIQSVMEDKVTDRMKEYTYDLKKLKNTSRPSTS